MYPTRLAALGIFLLLTAARQADAGILLTSSAAAPTTNVFASFDPGSDSNALLWRWTTDGSDHLGPGRMEIGQSFLVPVGPTMLLDKVTVRAREFGASVPGAGYTLEVWSFTDASDGVGDALLASQSDVIPAVPAPGSPAYWTFDIPDVALAGGGYYGFVLSFTAGPDAGRTVSLVQDFVGGYAGGRSVGRFGSPPDWPVNFGHDLTFYAQGGPQPTAVPEPTALLLVISGVTGLGVRRLLRRGW